MTPTKGITRDKLLGEQPPHGAVAQGSQLPTHTRGRAGCQERPERGRGGQSTASLRNTTAGAPFASPPRPGEAYRPARPTGAPPTAAEAAAGRAAAALTRRRRRPSAFLPCPSPQRAVRCAVPREGQSGFNRASGPAARTGGCHGKGRGKEIWR